REGFRLRPARRFGLFGNLAGDITARAHAPEQKAFGFELRESDFDRVAGNAEVSGKRARRGEPRLRLQIAGQNRVANPFANLPVKRKRMVICNPSQGWKDWASRLLTPPPPPPQTNPGSKTLRNFSRRPCRTRSPGRRREIACLLLIEQLPLVNR